MLELSPKFRLIVCNLGLTLVVFILVATAPRGLFGAVAALLLLCLPIDFDKLSRLNWFDRYSDTEQTYMVISDISGCKPIVYLFCN